MKPRSWLIEFGPGLPRLLFRDFFFSWLVNFVGFGNKLDYSSSENGAFIIKGFDGPFAKGKGV